MSKEVMLTVAIPTYNRAESLEKIIIQLNHENENSFLILISDDNSSDNTREIVLKYQKFMPNLIYSKNKVNLGFSGNVCRLYCLATTSYVWFLCDDDTVLPGAISKIYDAINKYSPTVALFNHTWVDSYGRKLPAGVKHDVLYDNIKKISNYLPLVRAGFLSILVVQKKISIDKLLKKKYMDNIFFQISLLLVLLSNKFIFCEVSSTIVHRNVGYKYGEFFRFCFLDFLKSIYIIDHKFDNRKFVDIKKKMIFMDLQLYLSQKLGLFRYEGQITLKTIKLMFQYYGFFYSMIILSFPIIKFIVPAKVIKFCYLVKLINIHGYKKGFLVYNESINRAITDKRKTGFTAYR